MNLRKRLEQLEKSLRDRKERDPGPVTQEDWLREFAAMDRAGLFADVPAFADELARYRVALEAAAARPDWDPPRDFMPDQPRCYRVPAWRQSREPPALGNAWDWLASMARDRLSGRRVLTRKEADEFSDWLQRNEHRLPRGLIELDGMTVHRAQLRDTLAHGSPRRISDLAMTVRRLIEVSGDQTLGEIA